MVTSLSSEKYLVICA